MNIVKNLIYFSLDNNKNYLSLAKISIRSLIKTGYDGDILFITRDFQKDLYDIFSNMKNKIYFLNPEHNFSQIKNGNNFVCSDYDRIFSSANKLRIFDFNEIDNYENIIYCDLDVLWLKSPDEMFKKIQKNEVSLSEETDLMSRDYYSANLIDSNEIEIINFNNIKGCSGAVFGFKGKDINIIKNIYNYFINNLDKVEGLFEQPFINMYLFKNKLYNTLFTDNVDHNGYYTNSSNKNILHFAGGPGEFDLKYSKIVNFIKNNADMFMKIKHFDTREEMFKTFSKKMKIAEVGVFRGGFSKFILEELEPAELHLIDIFEGNVSSGDKNGNNIEDQNLNESYENLKNLYKNNDSVYLHKGFSINILNNFNDNYFDIIYLDGDHSYIGIKNDLLISFNKIKNGGYITGHDYDTNNLKTSNNFNFGVKQAVNEFCVDYGQKICYLAKDGCMSFAIKVKKD